MTMTTPRPTSGDERASVSTTAASAISWTRVQAGLWVGKRNGDFAGMIESLPSGGFEATSRLALEVGIFATIAEAKLRLSELGQSELN
jgi:hypothetical protein